MIHTQSLDLNLLRTLAVLVQTRNVTVAANQLGVSQPAVSRALGRLREVLGDPLLIRANGSMELTHRARELAAPLQSWLSTAETLIRPQTVALEKITRHFRIATTEFGSTAIVGPALPRLAQAAPGVTLSIAGYSSEMRRRVITGEIDVILAGAPIDPHLLRQRHLFTETFCCIFRREHPILQEKDIKAGGPMSLSTYLAWSHIAFSGVGDHGDVIDHRLEALGVRRRCLMDTCYIQSAAINLDKLDAIITLPRRTGAHVAAREGLYLADAPAELGGLDYYAHWHERSQKDPILHWLVDELAAAAAA